MTSTVNDSETILDELQEITDDDLSFVEYTDEDGVGTGVGEYIIEQTYYTDKHVGQTLVADLINSSEIINVNVGGITVVDKNNEFHVKTWCRERARDGVPMQIYIDPDDTLGLGTRGTYVKKGDEDAAPEDIPDYIHFGHELIHAWRDIKGYFIEDDERVGVNPYDFPRLISEEELQTMGINYTVAGTQIRDYKSYRGIVSENGLRLENELAVRVSYLYSH